MSKKLLALLLALVMIVGSFTSVLAADPATETKKEDKKEPVAAEEKKDEKSEEKKDEKSEEKKDEKTEEKTEEKKEEKKEEVKDEALLRAQEVLKKAGIISGYSKDSEDFKAEKNVTRAEFASMIVRALNLEASAKSLATVPTGFKDVPTNLWANGYIAVAKQQGIINGYPNGTFQPNRQISYQDMATMLTIALGKAEVGTVYPAGYIVKAQQLGLFNKVDVPAYTDMATRGNVFKMVYNMVSSKEFGNRKIIKALVIENSRVEKLDKDEITVEVISVVQKANWAQDKKGDNHTYKLDKELNLDAEDLLGKVADFTVDQNDKIVEVKVDDTYNYVEGKVKNVSRNKIKVGGVYTVGMDERYDDTDERIVRTYLNNKAFAYRDFADEFRNKAYDFARITVKNGKVIFIDAYQFDDVAPVTFVKDGDVYYRDDVRNGDEYRASNLRRVVFHNAKGYSVAEVKDIVKDDVIHFYNDYRNAIVRKDAKVETKLVRTYENGDGQFVEGKDASYPLRFTKKFMALSSFEGKFYDVVKDRSKLKDIVGDDVKLLLALDNTVQLVETSKAWSEGIHAVKQIISKGEALLLPATTGEKFWAVETRDTKYMNIDDDKTTLNQKLFDINADDIVYYAGTDKNDIVKMGIIKTNKKYNNEMQLASMDTRYIYYGATPYRYFSGLNAFYVDKDGKDIQRIADIDQFRKDNAKNTKLQAYVMSEKQLRDNLEKHQELKIYNFLSDAKDIAKIVVFKNINGDPQYEYKYTVVDEKSWLDQAKFIDAEGKEYVVKLPEDNDIFNLYDIVKLGLDKSTIDKKDVKLAGKVKDVVISADQSTEKGKVYRIDRTRKTNTYELSDLATGKYLEDVYFDKDTKVFGTPTDYAQIYKDPDKKYSQYVLVIRYLDKDDVDFPGASKRVKLGLGSTYYNLVLNDVNENIDDQVLFLKEDGTQYGRGVVGFTQLAQAGYLGGEVLVIRERFGKIIAIKAVKTAAELNKTLKAEELAKDVKKLTTEVKLPSKTNNAQADLEKAIKKVLEDQISADKLKITVASVTVPAALDGTYTAVLQHPSDATVTENISGKYAKNANTTEDNAEAEAKKAEEAANVFANIPSLIKEVVDTNKDKKLDNTEILAQVKAAIAKEISLNADSPLKGFVDGQLKLDAADVKAKVNTTDVFEATFEYNGVKATTAIPFTLK